MFIIHGSSRENGNTEQLTKMITEGISVSEIQ